MEVPTTHSRTSPGLDPKGQHNSAAPSDPTAAPAKPADVPPKRRPWKRLMLVALLVGLVFLPQIIAATSLRHWAVRVARPELAEGTTVRSATFAWWEPIMVAGVEVPDDEGRPLLAIEHLTTDRTLWDILVLRNQPNRIDVESPTLTLRISTSGTNLDPTLQRLRERPPKTPESLEVHITDGHVDLLPDEGDGLFGSCANCIVDLKMTDGPQYQFTLNASGSASPAPTEENANITPSPINVSAKCTSTYDKGFLLGPGEFSVAAPEIVISQIGPLIPGIKENLQCDGTSDLTLAGSWREIAADNLSGTITFTARSEELVVTPLQANQLFPEPVTLDGDICGLSSHFLYSRNDDILEVGQLQVASRWLNANLTGQVADITGAAVVQLSGTADGDPAPWIDLLPPEVSEHLVLEGVALNEISVHGALHPSTEGEGSTEGLLVAARIGWSSAIAWGLTSTEGELQLGWDGEALKLDPIHVPFNGGHVVSLPDVLFREEGVALRFEPGALFEIAEVDEEIAREWLRYLSPLLASATAVQGSLSLSTAGGEIPLNRWQQAEFQGTLTIHEARITPGPRARSILSMVRQFGQMLGRRLAESETTLLMMPQQDIVLTIADERVHHDRLTLLAGDVEMRSTGSVGFDESLDIVFGLPIRDEWLADRPLIGAALRGETISLGMSGTLDDPDLDSSPLRDLSLRMGLRASGRLLFDLLDRGNDE